MFMNYESILNNVFLNFCHAFLIIFSFFIGKFYVDENKIDKDNKLKAGIQFSLLVIIYGFISIGAAAVIYKFSEVQNTASYFITIFLPAVSGLICSISKKEN